MCRLSILSAKVWIQSLSLAAYIPGQLFRNNTYSHILGQWIMYFFCYITMRNILSWLLLYKMQDNIIQDVRLCLSRRVSRWDINITKWSRIDFTSTCFSLQKICEKVFFKKEMAWSSLEKMLFSGGFAPDILPMLKKNHLDIKLLISRIVFLSFLQSLQTGPVDITPCPTKKKLHLV